MSTAPLLIDEISYDPLTRDEASLFFRLVSYRYVGSAMMLTTSKSIRDRPDLFAEDEILATAILDRFLHQSHVLKIEGASYRLRSDADLVPEHVRANASIAHPPKRHGRPPKQRRDDA